MNEVEIEHRLTEVEQRSKSNVHRLDKLEMIVNEIHTMSNTLVEMMQELKHTNEAVDSLNEKVDRMDSRVDEMEKAPAKEYSEIKKSTRDKVVSAIVGFVLAGIIWAAVQAF